MISRAWYVQCDGCGDPAPISVISAKEARAFARQDEGYVYVKRRDLCPRCQKKANESHA